MQTLLEMQDVSYAYDEEREALRGVNVKISHGERIAVLGANGAGKSTFFLLCNGILRPDIGSIYYNGEKVGHKNKDIAMLHSKVGIVFQEADTQIVAPTVKQEISFGPINLRLPTDEVLQRTNEAMIEMELCDFAQRAPHELSGGEKKRVTIADIIAMEPQIILMDEPSSSLDPKGAQGLELTLDMLHKKDIALVVATHNVDFAWRWASRIIVFCDGEIIADDTPEMVIANGEILERASLIKPTLYSAAEILLRATKTKGKIPKTIREFEDMVKEAIK